MENVRLKIRTKMRETYEYIPHFKSNILKQILLLVLCDFFLKRTRLHNTGILREEEEERRFDRNYATTNESERIKRTMAQFLNLK